MTTSIDSDRLELVFGRLLDDLSAQRYPYDHYTLPHDRDLIGASFPFGGIEHASFLFVLCYYMRGGMASVIATRALGKLYVKDPDLFVAAKAAQANPLTIHNSLDRVGLKYQKNRLPVNWVENARRLVERWGGDPRKIFVGIDDYGEACQLVCNDQHGGGFWGFQEKMTSMLLYFLMDEDLIDFFWFPPPVDFHMLRVAASTRIIRTDGDAIGQNLLSDQLLAEFRRELFDFEIRHQVSPMLMADATWLLSSKLCKLTPGNRVVQGEYQARSTKLTPYEPSWTKAEEAADGRSCGQCPLQDICDFNVGQAHYYRDGRLIRMRRRLRPPQLGLLESH